MSIVGALLLIAFLLALMLWPQFKEANSSLFEEREKLRKPTREEKRSRQVESEKRKHFAAIAKQEFSSRSWEECHDPVTGLYIPKQS